MMIRNCIRAPKYAIKPPTLMAKNPQKHSDPRSSIGDRQQTVLPKRHHDMDANRSKINRKMVRTTTLSVFVGTNINPNAVTDTPTNATDHRMIRRASLRSTALSSPILKQHQLDVVSSSMIGETVVIAYQTCMNWTGHFNFSYT